MKWFVRAVVVMCGFGLLFVLPLPLWGCFALGVFTCVLALAIGELIG